MPERSFDDLVSRGDEIIASLAAQADKWRADDPKAGLETASEMVHGDVYFGWFTSCEARVEEYFGAQSQELEEWRNVAGNGSRRCPYLC